MPTKVSVTVCDVWRGGGVLLMCRSLSAGRGGGSKFLPLYISTLLLVRVHKSIQIFHCNSYLSCENINRSWVEMCTGPKNIFWSQSKICLLFHRLYCLIMSFTEKCSLFQPVCFKISHRFSSSNNLPTIMTGTSLVLIDPEVIFSDYDNHSMFAIVLFCRENISLRNILFETLLCF
jgi:hypothetical protein